MRKQEGGGKGKQEGGGKGVTSAGRRRGGEVEAADIHGTHVFVALCTQMSLSSGFWGHWLLASWVGVGRYDEKNRGWHGLDDACYHRRPRAAATLHISYNISVITYQS